MIVTNYKQTTILTFDADYIGIIQIDWYITTFVDESGNRYVITSSHKYPTLVNIRSKLVEESYRTYQVIDYSKKACTYIIACVEVL